MELRDWIDINKLSFSYLSLNPNAIELLKKNHDKINWDLLSYNPNAIYLLEQYPENIVWKNLSYNPNAVHLLRNALLFEPITQLHASLVEDEIRRVVKNYEPRAKIASVTVTQYVPPPRLLTEACVCPLLHK